MNRLKQKSTWVGVASLISTMIAFLTGAIPFEIAGPALVNGAGLIAVNA